MTHDIELELHNRPNDGTAVSLVARRLQVCLLETRTGHVHDYAIRGLPDASLTVAPPGALAWCAHAEMVWNRVEWAERHGRPPILFELRTPIPGSLNTVQRHEFARDVAGFVARDLSVPVTVTVIDGNAPWPMRDAEGHQVRLCFPTRMLALNDGSNAIRDRSNEPSGFAARLMMVSNPHLAKAFVQRVTQEVGRLHRHPSQHRELRSSNPVASKASLAIFDEMDLLTDVSHPPGPKAVPTENPATHPLLVRLRREAPRGMTLPDLREFEISMGFARTVEDMLADVTAQENADRIVNEQHARIKTSVLDHTFQLDEARRHRARVHRELSDLKRKRDGLFGSLLGKREFASLARERKTKEVARAAEHVCELKAAVLRLQGKARALQGDCNASQLALRLARDELNVAVKGLHGSDPRLLAHLVSITPDPERDYLKLALVSAVPAPVEAEDAFKDHDNGGGQAGPPARPARGARPT